MKNMSACLLLFCLAGTPGLVAADSVKMASGDTVRTLLTKYSGKTVTLRMKDGGEITGVVQTIGNHLVHLGSLRGKEFFDATVDLAEVSALVIRTRDR